MLILAWYGRFLVFLGVLVEPNVCVAYGLLNWGSPALGMEFNGRSLLKLRCGHPNIAFDFGIVGLKEETMSQYGMSSDVGVGSFTCCMFFCVAILRL